MLLLLLLACRSSPPADPGGPVADLRPGAVVIEDRLGRGLAAPTLDELHALGMSPPPPPSTYDFTPPETIRVWRMSEGRASSCDGPVDVLPFEDYVKGVLPHEWIPSWDDESLRAGAVAIRTYSAYWVNAGGKYDCADICDTTSCQVYEDSTMGVTNDAVDATEGEYVVRGGSLVFAEYSAENGDPTADGVDDPYCHGEAVYGHGHGVCQWGTQRWASEGGKEHAWIIEHYYPGATVVVVNGDRDEDGYAGSDGDCNDDNPDVHPGATEVCNGLDDDCNGRIDGSDAVDALTFYRDADYDSYGDPDAPIRDCVLPSGYSVNDLDCDDTNALIHPGVTELCDFVDNDCDGGVDEGYDADSDGYETCAGDCDDGDPSRNPGAVEIEDGRDNDCDWHVDEGTSGYDDDGDGWTENAGDCDDGNPRSFPAAPELANGRDDDCDGLVDEGTVASDDDADGWTDAAGDCDDADPGTHPDAAEQADGRDNDCDGRVDEGTDAWDDDGDGWTELAGDCDDAARLSFPGGTEVVDGHDNDCDGIVDDHTAGYDDDGDGDSEAQGDCDDADPETDVGGVEVEDGRDNDCDGVVDNDTAAFDDDHDGWTEAAGDCNDADLRTWPGAVERPDRQDNDCDGVVDEGTVVYDDDGDGFTEEEGDCDDRRRDVWPGAAETVDGTDQDCDRLVDDQTTAFDDDQDGWSEEAGDCDDADPSVSPVAVERLDGRDDNCDGVVEAAEGWASGCATGPGAGALATLLALSAATRRRRVR